MLNLFSNRCFMRMVFSSLLVCTSLSATIQPAPDYTMGTNSVSFLIKLNKKIDKLKKCKKSSKRNSCLLSIKRECEKYLDYKFSLKESFKALENELKANGIPINEHFNKFKKAIKKKDKHHKAKRKFFSLLLQEDPTGILFLQEYEMTHYPQDHDEMATAYEMGFSFILAGFFLSRIPNPACQELSKWFIGSGVLMVTGQYSIDQDKVKDQRRENQKGGPYIR